MCVSGKLTVLIVILILEPLLCVLLTSAAPIWHLEEINPTIFKMEAKS